MTNTLLGLTLLVLVPVLWVLSGTRKG